MKTLKTFVVMFMLLIAFNLNAQSEKTLIKTLSLDGMATAVFDLPGEITIKEWDKDYVRITATVSTGNYNEDFLKKVISAGRYDIVSRSDNGDLLINMPKIVNKITLNGVTLIENLKFEINTPYGSISSKPKSDNLLK
jgi:hypothetical protein